MSKRLIVINLVLIVLLSFSNSCSKKEPSVIKIYVRSLNNSLVPNSDVVIISDLQSGTNIPPYVDTLKTNSSGYATFEIDSFFDLMGSDQSSCDFDVIAKKDTLEGIGKLVSVSKNTTHVETVYLY